MCLNCKQYGRKFGRKSPQRALCIGGSTQKTAPRVLVAVRPQGRTTVDLAGHSRIAFKRALQHENVLVGEARSSARTFPLYKEARPPSAATRNAVPPRRREKMSDDAKFILDFG